MSETGKEQIFGGTLDLQPGAAIQATDGPVGIVGDLLLEPETGEVTHFVLQGRWQRRAGEISLPLSAVDRVEGETVYLKLDREAVEQLPAIPAGRLKAAQAGGAKIDLVAVAFDGPGDAGQALKFIDRFQKKGTLKILNAAVLASDAQGNVSVKDTRDIDPKKGRLLGAITGGLIGLAGGPVGAVVGALAGAGAGGLAEKKIDLGFSEPFLEGLTQYLKPGTSALIVLVEHDYYHQLSDMIAEEKGVFFRQTLTDRLVEKLTAEGE